MSRMLFLMLALAVCNAQASLPEIPFCPLGGPPGWYNRLVDDDGYRYPPPAYGYGRPPYPGTPYYHPARLMPPRQFCDAGVAGACVRR